MYAISIFLFQNIIVSYFFSFFSSQGICTIKKKLQRIFQLFQDKKNRTINDFVLSFVIGLYPQFIIFQRSGVDAREFRNVANNLLLRLMIVVEDTVKELGITKEELREVQRKRSYITACYFQAVTCY